MPPSATVMQIRARLHEFQQQDAHHSGHELKAQLVLLNKAAKKEDVLLQYCNGLVPGEVTFNMTIAQLYSKAEEAITVKIAPRRSNPMQFGKYGHLTYQEVKDQHPSYVEWERSQSKSRTHVGVWQLAQWLNQEDNPEEVKPLIPVTPIHKQANINTTESWEVISSPESGRFRWLLHPGDGHRLRDRTGQFVGRNPSPEGGECRM